MKQSLRPREAGGALQGKRREGDCQLEGSGGRKGTEHQGREAELQTAQDRGPSHAHTVHPRAHTHTDSHSPKHAHTCTKQTLKHTPYVCTHRHTRTYFTVYSQMQGKHTIAYTHVRVPVSTCTHAAPGTYALVCTCAHTHTHTCTPVMHPCTGSGRNQLCEHNKETDGAEHGHRPTGLIYREVTVTLWGAVSGAKRVEKVAGKERVQGL